MLDENADSVAPSLFDRARKINGVRSLREKQIGDEPSFGNEGVAEGVGIEANSRGSRGRTKMNLPPDFRERSHFRTVHDQIVARGVRGRRAQGVKDPTAGSGIPTDEAVVRSMNNQQVSAGLVLQRVTNRGDGSRNADIGPGRPFVGRKPPKSPRGLELPSELALIHSGARDFGKKIVDLAPRPGRKEGVGFAGGEAEDGVDLAEETAPLQLLQGLRGRGQALENPAGDLLQPVEARCEALTENRKRSDQLQAHAAISRGGASKDEANLSTHRSSKKIDPFGEHAVGWAGR